MDELKGHENRVSRVLRDIRFTFAALAAGSRTVPLADNREVIADLAARAACIYGVDTTGCQVDRRPARPE